MRRCLRRPCRRRPCGARFAKRLFGQGAAVSATRSLSPRPGGKSAPSDVCSQVSKSAPHELELACGRVQRHAPQHEPQRGVARLHHFNHCLGGANRIARLACRCHSKSLAGVLPRFRRNLRLWRFSRAPGPIRAERPRLHDHHLDSERFDLLRQSLPKGPRRRTWWRYSSPSSGSRQIRRSKKY